MINQSAKTEKKKDVNSCRSKESRIDYIIINDNNIGRKNNEGRR